MRAVCARNGSWSRSSAGERGGRGDAGGESWWCGWRAGWAYASGGDGCGGVTEPVRGIVCPRQQHATTEPKVSNARDEEEAREKRAGTNARRSRNARAPSPCGLTIASAILARHAYSHRHPNFAPCPPSSPRTVRCSLCLPSLSPPIYASKQQQPPPPAAATASARRRRSLVGLLTATRKPRLALALATSHRPKLLAWRWRNVSGTATRVGCRLGHGTQNRLESKRSGADKKVKEASLA